VVNTSLKEGYGLTGIEANSCGTVVVATDVQGLRDSIRDGDTGFLVTYGNRVEFREKIGFLLSNPEVRRKMEKQAITWAASHKWENTFNKTHTLLLKELESGRRK
jgi:glycosyltransferase involved in cell wall biosynthesis